jgi:hypothetical protein
MKNAVLVLAVLASGCASNSYFAPKLPVGGDGYTFQRQEWSRPGMQVSIKVHPTQSELEAAMPKGVKVGKGYERENVHAFSEIKSTSCVIHVVAPVHSWQPEWLGHELAHCFWGHWHD